MNTKNNKRRRESVEKIQKAFIEFLQTKELNEIKVSDICKAVGVNRSTFYANFVDIYDLADKIREHLEEEFNELYKEEMTLKYSKHNYLKLLHHIKDNQLYYKTYFKLGYDNNHNIAFYDDKQAKLYFDNKYIDYHIQFFKNGFNAIIKMWLARNCKESPEEINEIIVSEYRGRGRSES